MTAEPTLLSMAEEIEAALLKHLESRPALPRKLLAAHELRYLSNTITCEVHLACPWARQHVYVKATQDRDTRVEFSLHPDSLIGEQLIEVLRATRGEEWDEVSGLPYCDACGTTDTRLLAAGEKVCSACRALADDGGERDESESGGGG